MGAVARQVSNLPPVYVRGNLIHSDHLEHSTMMMMMVMMVIMRVIMMMLRVMMMMMITIHIYKTINMHKEAITHSIRLFFLQTLMMTFE